MLHVLDRDIAKWIAFYSDGSRHTERPARLLAETMVRAMTQTLDAGRARTVSQPMGAAVRAASRSMAAFSRDPEASVGQTDITVTR
ncbi:hypothetical protein [Rhizobium leucaenae]|uniref:hypothetical protein n=1 Tax=Rhizobium leucaenae TaxID=29450 RepID=UPI00161667DB|nr:hypothetical protein [Rhizobium leucaenae]MBB6303696.1 hypothetical protein [Rhizobium leucaenae]